MALAAQLNAVPVEVDPVTDINSADNALIIFDDDVQNMDKADDHTEIDLKADDGDAPLIGDLPAPDPAMWSGYIYKMSRHVKQLRLRHVVVSLKHATLSTFTDDSQGQVTEQIPLKHYRVDMLTDANILAECRGEVKAWDEFVLVPSNPNGNHPTFYFCGSYTANDDAENGKYVKAAVICAMAYKLAQTAIKQENYAQAKEDLLLMARHMFRLEETRERTMKQRLEVFEKWMNIALRLPWNPKSKMAQRLQCTLLRCHAYYMMNTFGDKWLGLETIYEKILEIDPDDEITLTYYGQWLVEGGHGIKKGLEYLKRASGGIVALWDFEDENIKNKRFKEPLQAQTIMELYIAKRLNKGQNVSKQ